MVLQLVKVDSLFDQDGTANQNQIIEQRGGQGKDIVLSFVQKRGAKLGNVSHVTKHDINPRFCYLNPLCPGTVTNYP